MIMITILCTELVWSLRFLSPMRWTRNCSRQFLNRHFVRPKLKKRFESGFTAFNTRFNYIEGLFIFKKVYNKVFKEDY